MAKFILDKHTTSLTDRLHCHVAVKKTNTKHYLVVVFIQHDDNLSHVVELRDSTEVIHGTLPLLVLLLLSYKFTHTQPQLQCLPPSEKHSQFYKTRVYFLTSSKPP